MASLLKTPKAPAVTPPAVMPTPVEGNDAEKLRQRQATAAKAAASGRQSTFLSGSDKLGY